MKLVVQLILWVVIVFLGYLTFNAVYAPIQFNKVKEARYKKVIERLKDIRKAELAHKEVTGEFAPTFDRLVKFIDTAKFTITERRDTTYLDEEYKKSYGVDKYKGDVVIDTIGFVSVKDSLFKGTNRYKELKYVPTTNKEEEFQIGARKIKKNNTAMPVFEVKVAKEVILKDQDKDLVAQEKQIVSVEEVNGPYIQVGSLNEVNTSGNWPKVYGDNDK
ncbi:MAG: hypothetical protein ACTJGD_05190 [Mesonia hippocampi]|uniref:Uncharacterized protein n=1 Tax=Mesonia hippocampi TaxID=1628250 RepID=A0A840EN67_9FLAO|nr:hypothetical protein [Mesonia hippocampi]MBB4119568.1 hypothetical protein [Mesonia hippocampi]